jgi:hypothetical protein
MNRLKRTVWTAAGTSAVVLGLIGIAVPVLPTTPFLLLAAYCYARGSRRFLHWLLNNHLFGAYITAYREGRGIPRRQKVLTIAALWLTIGWTGLFAVPVWWVQLPLLGVAVGVTAHLLRSKTLLPEDQGRPAPRVEPAETPD